MNTNTILDCFLAGQFPQMSCPQCENTFLTNVYEIRCDATHDQAECRLCRETLAQGHLTDWSQLVVLEKYALGLEYFYDAIQQWELTQVPFIRRLGVLDENNQLLDPSVIQLFSNQEPNYRILYVMERLEHLADEDAKFFTEQIHGMDWQEEAVRLEIQAALRAKYGDALANDVRRLCIYFREHEEYLAWDLHGENLMRRPSDGQIVVMDPYIPKI